MHFASPQVLLLLFALPVLFYFSHYRRRPASLRFSSTARLAALETTLRVRCQRWLPALRFLALALLVVALARPQQGQERVRDLSRGIAIQMVLDRSGSMAEEMAFDGQVMNRLDVVKRVFKEFVAGNGDSLDGRPNDLIGLVTFAGYADTIAPLTLGHDTLLNLVDDIQLVQLKSEDGTAIGDGLALAAARLKTAEESQMRVNARIGSDYEIKSKIIILLTDGQNNRGEMEPEEAARLAKEWGIKVYVIGIGDDPETGRFSGPFAQLAQMQQRNLNEDSLTALADMTGGIYRRAGSGNALREIYEEIGALETSEIESLRYLDYQERFLPFGLGGLVLLLAEAALQATWLRRQP